MHQSTKEPRVEKQRHRRPCSVQNAGRQQQQTRQRQQPLNQHAHYFYVTAPAQQRTQRARNACAPVLSVKPHAPGRDL